MPTKRKFKSAAVQELYDELIDDDTAAQEEFEGGLVNIEVAQLIYAMRTKAGLSQRELARKVGTSASAVNRLEAADYQGHTIAMVRRIAINICVHRRSLDSVDAPPSAPAAPTAPSPLRLETSGKPSLPSEPWYIV